MIDRYGCIKLFEIPWMIRLITFGLVQPDPGPPSIMLVQYAAAASWYQAMGTMILMMTLFMVRVLFFLLLV